MLKITWLPAQASTDAAQSFPHIEAQFQGWVHQCPSPQQQIREHGANEGVLTVTLSLSQGLSIALPPSSSKSTKSILKDGNHNAVLTSFLVWTYRGKEKAKVTAVYCANQTRMQSIRPQMLFIGWRVPSWDRFYCCCTVVRQPPLVHSYFKLWIANM